MHSSSTQRLGGRPQLSSCQPILALDKRFSTISTISSQTRQPQEDIKQRMSFAQRTERDQRDALMSGFNRKNLSYTKIGKPSDADRHATQMTSDLEAQNAELYDEVHEKILGLKEIALNMRGEVRESHSLLDQMSSVMTTAGGLLGTTITRLQSLASFRVRIDS